MSLLNHDAVSLLKNNLYRQKDLKESKFEDRYVKLRDKEGRLYKIEELRTLPLVSKNSPYRREWNIRFKAASNLVSYFRKIKKEMKILDVGCGNGWLSNVLASIPHSEIVGLDINRFELEQASEAFTETKNVTFIYGDLFEDIFHTGSFDAVILAASVQYFEDPERLLSRLFELLHNGGEIHILDSPIYKKDQLSSASGRSTEYFTRLGFPEMKDHYFHHSIDILDRYAINMMYDSSTFHNRILRKFIFKSMSPFPWIRVKRK